MHPILFRLPFKLPGSQENFPIRSFGVMVAIGVLLAAHVLARLASRYDPHPRPGDTNPLDAPARYGTITVWIILGVFLGARLMYVLVEMGRGTWHAESPLDYIAIWKGGIAMYGGFFGGIVAGILGALKAGVSPLRASDLALTASFFGLALGRIGCYLVGDDYGAVVPPGWEHAPFPIVLHVPSAEQLAAMPHSLFGMENAGRTLWATEIWMSLNAFVLAFLGLRWIRHRRYYGQVALRLALAYALTRGTIEFFRGDEVRGVWFGGTVSSSQLIAVVSGTVAAVLLFAFRKRRDPDLAGPQAAP
jgi:phosphatidylglycerol---prolipoprotein diacylglyceryl transferase